MAEYTGPIQHKRGTSSQWASSSVPLREGELGYDTTVKRSKMGDGASLWPSLPWQTPDQALLERLDAVADAVAGATTPTDAVTAANIADTDSATRAQLNTAFVEGIEDDESDIGQALTTKIVQVGSGAFVPVSDPRPTMQLIGPNVASDIPNGVKVFPFTAADDNDLVGVQNDKFTFLRAPVRMNRTAPSGFFLYGAQNKLTDAARQRNVTVAFVHDDDAPLDIYEYGYANAARRITVDGVIVTEGPDGWVAPPTDNKLYQRRLTFATRKPRLIVVEDADNQFPGVVIGPRGTIQAAPILLPRAIALGDSVTASDNMDVSPYGVWTVKAAEDLGWDIWDAGQGGTGYDNAGTFAGYAKAVDRIPTDVAPYAPKYVIFAYGLNDQSPAASSATRRTRIREAIAALKAQSPASTPILLGPFYTRNPEPLVDEVHEDIRIVALEDGLHFVPTKGFITGQKSQNTGNSSAYLSGDTIHPNYLGGQAWGHFVATGIKRALANPPVPTASVPFSDTFTRADSATTLGAGWTALAGVWGVAGGRAYVVSGGNTFLAAVHEAGTPNVDMTAKVAGSNAGSMGFAIRAQDAANYLYLAFADGGGMKLYKYVAGAVTQIGSGAATVVSNDTIRVVTNGNTITVYRNGTQVFTVTDATFASATKHGLWTLGTADPSARSFDDFTMTAA